MSKKMYKVFAPNGKYVDIFLKGNIVHFKHGEIVEIEKELAEQFSFIFYEVKSETKKPQESSKEKKEDKIEKPQVESPKEKDTKERANKKKNKKEK